MAKDYSKHVAELKSALAKSVSRGSEMELTGGWKGLLDCCDTATNPIDHRKIGPMLLGTDLVSEILALIPVTIRWDSTVSRSGFCLAVGADLEAMLVSGSTCIPGNRVFTCLL